MIHQKTLENIKKQHVLDAGGNSRSSEHSISYTHIIHRYSLRFENKKIYILRKEDARVFQPHRMKPLPTRVAGVVRSSCLCARGFAFRPEEYPPPPGFRTTATFFVQSGNKPKFWLQLRKTGTAVRIRTALCSYTED